MKPDTHYAGGDRDLQSGLFCCHFLSACTDTDTDVLCELDPTGGIAHALSEPCFLLPLQGDSSTKAAAFSEEVCCHLFLRI